MSKPIAAPFHDGTKCLVRDIASNLERVRPVVMGTRGAAQSPGGPWDVAAVYGDAGHFAPSLKENLRAALWLAARSDAELWHFVFAPNPKSSEVGRWLRRLRRKPVVQTVASPPRDMTRPGRLLFGDVVVAQSRWTADALRAGAEAERIVLPRFEVIPPPVPDIARRSDAVVGAVLRALDLEPGAPLFVYPGDLEVSQGAETVARLVKPLCEAVPGARIVFAYRDKTPRASEVAMELAARLDPAKVRFTKQLQDVLALIQPATAVLFPVDDLWGKVDLPIVLLESMALGVPVLALNEGPLRDLEGARLLPQDDRAWLDAARALLDPDERAAVADSERAAVERLFSAPRVAARYEALYLDLLAARRG